MAPPLHIAVVTPDSDPSLAPAQSFLAPNLKSDVEDGRVDLIVFPEAFRDAVDEGHAGQVARAWASEYQCPVLLGITLKDGYESACYATPGFQPGNTRRSVYYKHSCAPKLAFEHPRYVQRRERFLDPFLLKGVKIGVVLSQDLQLGLVVDRFRQKGADLLIALGGEDLPLGNWKSVVRGRSAESLCPIIAGSIRKGPRMSVGHSSMYREGICIAPKFERIFHRMRRYAIFHTQAMGFAPDKLAADLKPMAVANNSSMCIDLCSHPSAQNPNDARVRAWVTLKGGALRVSGRELTQEASGWAWFPFPQNNRPTLRVGVTTFPVGALTDARAVHRLMAAGRPYDCHILVYGGDESPLSHYQTMCLLQLRAIEHGAVFGFIDAGRTELVKRRRGTADAMQLKRTRGAYILDRSGTDGSFVGEGLPTMDGIPSGAVATYLQLLDDAPGASESLLHRLTELTEAPDTMDAPGGAEDDHGVDSAEHRVADSDAPAASGDFDIGNRDAPAGHDAGDGEAASAARHEASLR